MGIVINTVKAQIGVKSTPGVQTIQQPKGILEINKTKTEMNIDKELPKVNIDQHQCFAEAGLKNIFELIEENAQLGKQRAYEAIGRIVDEGNRLASIENGFSAIPDIAYENMGMEREFNVKFIPQSRPEITVTGHLNINWQIGKTETHYTPKKPIISYQTGKVEVYLRQKPSIEMKYIDKKA